MKNTEICPMCAYLRRRYMNKELLQVLNNLSKYFDKPLYIVGGAVRNYLCDFTIDDVDLAAAISPHEIINKLANTSFKVKHTSKKLFTLLIKKDNYSFEFTSFRKDSYQKGYHRPDSCSLTDDIITDAKRRDFTVNAIYYDINGKKIVDPLSGCQDLKAKKIKTVIEPEEVFSQDGLRLMRLARLAAETDMEIEEKTFLSAKSNAHLIKDIAPERIRDEFNRIVEADTKYGIEKAHLKGLLYLDRLNILNYILPELIRCKGVKQRRDYHKYDVYGHILKAFECAPKDVRLATLFHDIAKPLCIHEDGSMKGHDKKGAEVAAQIMERLRYPKKEINQTARLVSLHMYDLKCQAKEFTLMRFIQKNYDIIDKVIALKKADYFASGTLGDKCRCAERIEEAYGKMKTEGIPFTTKELKVNGQDLIKLNIPKEKRSVALQRLLHAATLGGKMLTKQAQLEYIKKNKRTF